MASAHASDFCRLALLSPCRSWILGLKNCDCGILNFVWALGFGEFSLLGFLDSSGFVVSRCSASGAGVLRLVGWGFLRATRFMEFNVYV